MPATVDLPGVGPVKTVYVVGAVAAGIGLFILRQRASASAAADAVPADSGPGAVADPFGDGLTAAEGFGDASSGSAAGGFFGGTSDLKSEAPTTNAEWTQAAIDYLMQLGVDGGTLSEALGLYLESKPMTASQQSMVRRAIAVMGYPPTGTHQIIGITATTVAAPTGLHAIDTTNSSLRIGWTPSTGAASYNVYEGIKRVAVARGTFYTASNRKPGTSYGPWTVTAVSSTGTESGRSNAVTVKTTGGALAAPVVHVFDIRTTFGVLAWKEVVGTRRYRIYRGSARIATVNGTYWTVQGLKPGTRTGPYTVRSESSAGVLSGPSNAVYITTQKK